MTSAGMTVSVPFKISVLIEKIVIEKGGSSSASQRVILCNCVS